MPGAAAILQEHARLTSVRRSASSPTKRPNFVMLRDRFVLVSPSPAQSMPTVAEIPLDEHAHKILDGPSPPSPSPGQRKVFLPLRYTRDIRKRNSRDLENELGRNKDERPGIEVSEKLSDREKDFEQALKWLRQEIVHLKQQDKGLMRDLLETRAEIRQLQGIRSCQSVGCNLATLGVPSPPLSPGDPECHPIGFQNRTVSMTSFRSVNGNDVTIEDFPEEDESVNEYTTYL